MDITICTASNGVYREIMDRTKATAEELGYKMDVYDLGGLGYGKRFDPKSTPGREHLWKPEVMRLSRMNNRGNLVWLDADALLNGPLDDAFDDFFDMGLVLRPDWARPSSRDGKYAAVRLDTGAIYLRDTPNAKLLLDEWIRVQDKFNTGNDIKPLTTYLGINRNYYTDSLGKVFDIKGFQVRFMEQIYCAYCKTRVAVREAPRGSRVYHFFRSDGLSGWDSFLSLEDAAEGGEVIW